MSCRPNLLISSLTILFSLAVLDQIQAQTPPPAPPGLDQAERVQENILRLQRQQKDSELKRLERERHSFKKSPITDLEKELPLGKIFRKGRQCVYMRVIYLKGDPYLGKSTHDELVRELTRRCLGPQEINYLIRKVTNYYISEGFITTRIYIPEQNLNDGTFELRVVPGYIEEIVFHEKKGFKSEIATAFPTLSGRRLNLRHIEQGLEQINRLQTNSARMRLFPGKKAGFSRVIIDRQTTKPWHTSFGLSDSGSKSTGLVVSNASISLDNLLFINDSCTFGINRNVQGANNPGNFSRSQSLSCSIPLGYWTASYYMSNSKYNSIIQGSNFKYSVSGKSVSDDLSLERVIYRRVRSKTVISGSTKSKSNTNFLEDTKVDVSSRSTRTTKLYISHDHSLVVGDQASALSLGNVGFGIGYRFGTLSSFVGDLGTNETALSLRFTKIEGHFHYSYPFAIKKQIFSYQLNYEQQYTKDILYSEEQISLGGLYTVRGFKDQLISADIGYVARNELHWHPKTSVPNPHAGFWGNPSFFIAYDIGLIDSNTRSGEVGSLQGVAIGTNSSGQYGNYSLTLSQSVAWPDTLEQEKAVWLSVGFRF